MESALNLLSQLLGADLKEAGINMSDSDDEDDVSVVDFDEGEESMLTPDQLAVERQRASLQTYLDSLPYKCESAEEMQAKLDRLISKLIICAKAKNWLVLSSWDPMLHCWLLMRYPMRKSTRIQLIKFYYELCLVPGIEGRVIREWADMISRLLASKSGLKRRLDPSELQLDWKPLWRVVRKELWPKVRLYESSRNMINIFIYIADRCKRYFPATEIENMLSMFLPLLTQESFLTIMPVVTSFLPQRRPHLYMPIIFKLWESFNSYVLDDILIGMVGDLAEEHVAGPAGFEGESDGAQFKDVGIWSDEEWAMLMTKGLGSMHVPIGKYRGANTTAVHADGDLERKGARIKKSVIRQNALAKLIVYSMAVDGAVRADSRSHTPSIANGGFPSQQSGYLAGSKALDSLEKLITSTESYFHPSNSGTWTIVLTSFLQRLMTEFIKRWQEEQQRDCKTPPDRRLTPAIRRAFVTLLRTPSLIAMFSKDPISMGCAMGALRNMALFQPELIMPDLLERAYGGLEVVNETHRTTAVLTMLSSIALPLVSEQVWLGGQKHVVPLLELCIPGIDLNDPIKTMCATLFITRAAHYMKIGDLSMHKFGQPLTDEALAEEQMEVDDEYSHLPDGSDMGQTLVLDRQEERLLVRESTASFADWVTSLFRRVFALIENLPEEGGIKHTNGGKQEENAMKSIRSMMDTVCGHLSDQLFDLVLNLVYDYATNNAKANAIRAMGQLVSSLARAKPEQTIAKFMPFCVAQIREELNHGASSMRTTSSHQAVPSDTTLHWNIHILRGCLGSGGRALLKYQQEIIGVLCLLVEKTKSERGYTATGRLITRILNTLSSVYPVNNRFVNDDEWSTPDFDQNHNTQWGRLCEVKDVKVDWHVPNSEEIQFILQILEQVASPALDQVEAVLDASEHWDNVARNDFCRFLHAVRSVWNGLPTIYKEGTKVVVNPCLDEDTEMDELLIEQSDVQAGFALTEQSDPRYQIVVKHRARFGAVIQRAGTVLRQGHEGEDHIDAVMGVAKAMDTFLLMYGVNRSDFDGFSKSYAQSKFMSRMWSRQKNNSRHAWVKRAQLYHSGRVYMHSIYRRRSQLDDEILHSIVELSVSPYLRVRRYSQAVLANSLGYYVRSTRFLLPPLLDALREGNDPDRMKGALYVLGNKGTIAYALGASGYYKEFLVALLKCQHEEKVFDEPSVQNLVNVTAHDCLPYLSEEAIYTDAFTDDTAGVDSAVGGLEQEVPLGTVDERLIAIAHQKTAVRVVRRNQVHVDTISSILEIATKSSTHWRYVQVSIRWLAGMLRRDAVVPPELAKFFMDQTTSPQQTTRLTAQRAISRLTAFVKMRTYSTSSTELWLDDWRNPLQRDLPIPDIDKFIHRLKNTLHESEHELYFDKLHTGFVMWTSSVKYYTPAQGSSKTKWEGKSQPTLAVIDRTLGKEYFSKLLLLWGQESNKSSDKTGLRSDNVSFIRILAKMFEDSVLDELLDAIDPLIWDSDKYKQRAGAEVLAGLLRGCKNWPKQLSARLWSWVTARLDRIFLQMKPDTTFFWESFYSVVLADLDPRRNMPLINWILSLPFEFQGDSAFSTTKVLTLVSTLIDTMGIRFHSLTDKYAAALFGNLNTDYAEVRRYTASALHILATSQWRPAYPSVAALLDACQKVKDPFHIREPFHAHVIAQILRDLPQWKEQRLPPPRVNQSEYDKVALTLLQVIWVSFHNSEACLAFPYAARMLPEILKMSELNDNSQLQEYSSAVLQVLSVVYFPADFVEDILDAFVTSIKSSTSWRIRLNAFPALVMFFYRNLMSISPHGLLRMMDVVLDCLVDENVEVREMAAKSLSGVVRCSQRQTILPLKDRFVTLARRIKLPARNHPEYGDSLRKLHSAILGICALIESFPYSIEPWMPPLTEVLAHHATDPPPISTTIRKCASEFKKTHQDTWHKDQHAFDEEQLQSLSTMLVGTSYYA